MKTKLTLALLALSLNIHAADVAADAGKAVSWSDRIGLDTLAIARTTDLESFNISAAARLSYDLTPRLGIVLEVEGDGLSGKTLVDSTFAGVRFALPVRKTLRPYLIGGAGLKFPSNTEYLAGGAGVEVALGKSWRVFGEGLAEKSSNTDASLRFGAGLGFRF